MKIKSKSIRSLTKVLEASGETKEIRLAFSTKGWQSDLWVKLGFQSELVNGHYLIPSIIGKTTLFNAQGKEIVRKDLPKISSSVMYFGTTRDWHGGVHSGIKTRSMQKYPREIIFPPSQFMYVIEINGVKYIASSVLKLISEDEEKNLHVCNMMLECFGEFDIIDSNSGLVIGPKLKRVQWEILPKGEYPWSKSKSIIQDRISRLEEKDRKVIEYRMEVISNYKPNFLASGLGGLSGYFVYGFESEGIYVFESIHLDNATYVFYGSWQDFSKLTKTEIINSNIDHTRLLHDKKWRFKLKEILRQINH